MADKKKTKGRSAKAEAMLETLSSLFGGDEQLPPDPLDPVAATPPLDRELLAQYAEHLAPQGVSGTAGVTPDISNIVGFPGSLGGEIPAPQPISTELPLKPVRKESQGVADELMKRLDFLRQEGAFRGAERARGAEERKAKQLTGARASARELEPLYKAISAKEAARFLPGYAGPLSVPPVDPEEYGL